MLQADIPTLLADKPAVQPRESLGRWGRRHGRQQRRPAAAPARRRQGFQPIARLMWLLCYMITRHVPVPMAAETALLQVPCCEEALVCVSKAEWQQAPQAGVWPGVTCCPLTRLLYR